MNIFNRTLLFQDPNPEAAAKVWTELRKAGIPYSVKTKGKSGTSAMVRFGTGGRNGTIAGGSATETTYRTGGTPQSWMEQPGAAGTFYAIYVKKADLEKAKAICDLV